MTCSVRSHGPLLRPDVHEPEVGLHTIGTAVQVEASGHDDVVAVDNERPLGEGASIVCLIRWVDQVSCNAMLYMISSSYLKFDFNFINNTDNLRSEPILPP